MRILLTRPETDATDLKRHLEALGHVCLVAPVLAIEPCPPPALLVQPADALIATSRNALRAIEGHTELARLVRIPIIVVGPATAALARKLGFAEVVEGPATARDLPRAISARFPEHRATLVHLTGDAVAFDLVAALKSAGFSASQVTVYRSVAVGSLPAETITALRSGVLDACIVMSPRTALQFATLILAAGLGPEAQRLTYLCLSPAVATNLDPIAPAKVMIAAHPRLEEVLALIAGLAENWRD